MIALGTITARSRPPNSSTTMIIGAMRQDGDGLADDRPGHHAQVHRPDCARSPMASSTPITSADAKPQQRGRQRDPGVIDKAALRGDRLPRHALPQLRHHLMRRRAGPGAPGSSSRARSGRRSPRSPPARPDRRTQWRVHPDRRRIPERHDHQQDGQDRQQRPHPPHPLRPGDQRDRDDRPAPCLRAATPVGRSPKTVDGHDARSAQAGRRPTARWPPPCPLSRISRTIIRLPSAEQRTAPRPASRHLPARPHRPRSAASAARNTAIAAAKPEEQPAVIAPSARCDRALSPYACHTRSIRVPDVIHHRHAPPAAPPAPGARSRGTPACRGYPAAARAAAGCRSHR